MKSGITTEDMKTYLKNVVELESSAYGQEKAKDTALNKLKFQARCHYGIRKKDVKQPSDKSTTMVEPEKPTYTKTAKTSTYILFLVLFTALGFLLIAMGSRVLGIVMLALALLCCFGVKSNSSDIKDNEEKKQKYEQDIETYRENVKTAQEEYSQAIGRYYNEKKIAEEEYQRAYDIAKANYDEAEQTIRQLDKPLEETKEILAKMYAADYIFPKYRNMVAMCTIYEYFASGRVTALEGPDGAYNLYESELRQNLIINRLDIIVTQLDQIKENQYTLYVELKKTNDMLGGISHDIKKILDNTERIANASQATALATNITACCLQAIEKNTAAVKYLTLING